jgi:hypothetical protein
MFGNHLKIVSAKGLNKIYFYGKMEVPYTRKNKMGDSDNKE